MSVDNLREVFAALPPLREFRPDQFAIQPLPGLTNHNYRLQGQSLDYVLRLPGRCSEYYLDRRAEIHNLRQAVQLGLTPELVYADPVSGILLSWYLPGRSLKPIDLCQDGHLEKGLSMLRRLHQSDAEFRGHWPLFATLEQYRQWSSPPWRPKLTDLLQLAEHWRPEIEQNAQPFCACHCDPNPANFRLQPNDRLWLLDWEYSAQAEPAWDLAALAVEAELDAERLIRLYAGKTDPLLLRRVHLHIALLHLLTAAWSAAQIGLGNRLGNQSEACLEETIRQRLSSAASCIRSL